MTSRPARPDHVLIGRSPGVQLLSTGITDMPTLVRLYSTHGGDSLRTLLTISPSASSSLSAMVSMRDDPSPVSLLRSLNLMLPWDEIIQRIRILCLPPRSLIDVVNGGSPSGILSMPVRTRRRS